MIKSFRVALIYVFFWNYYYSPCESLTAKPNIVIIMADDLGFNDLSMRGSNEIITPNIDALAYNSIILDRFYTPAMCTPSRSSLMTGKYPHRVGMQDFVIPSDEPWGLPLGEKLLPQYMQSAGYETALVGKWHLGFHKKTFTPNQRGFDKFFGYLGPYIDYWDYSLYMSDKLYARGFDMRRNYDVARNESKGEYATKFFTQKATEIIDQRDPNKPLYLQLNHLAPHAANQIDPMQAPQSEIDKFRHIHDPKRRTLAAMISMLDEGVGDIVQSLAKNNILNNTIIFFYSDNGGPTVGLHSTAASNYPLRGQKNSAWEGAMRVNSFVFVPDVLPGIRRQLVHVSDILPTIASIAGFQINGPIDGVSQWEMIRNNVNSPRNEVINLDNIAGFGSLIQGSLKYLTGTTMLGIFDGSLSSRSHKSMDGFVGYNQRVWNSKTQLAMQKIRSFVLNLIEVAYVRQRLAHSCNSRLLNVPCKPLVAPCLFDIINDPCEQNNLANSRDYRVRFEIIKSRYEEILKTAVPSQRKPADAACDPRNFNNTWTWWQGEL